MKSTVAKWLAAGVWLGGALWAQTPAKPSEAKVDFQREIRPILSDKCFACHGPDENNRKVGLRLDTPEGAFALRNGQVAIKPGHAAESRVMVRVAHEKRALRMPPPAVNNPLSEKEIDLLRRWIDQGAQYETHWAFKAPQRAEPPAVKQTGWAKNAIDQFVLARLEREGLKPSAAADKATLLRRVTFDLTGLPPTPAEVQAFLQDKSPEAYERAVDRLLASPRYGERMAMQWLDVARYADTHGYHIDSHRDMWPWRDWVIKAFNSNMPYDRFATEQLAGDLLPQATLDQKIASGFNRNHMINFEGGAIPEEYQVEYVADRVETTSTAFLGLTMGCARCHTHKYDPITHKEFYRFFAFFNNVAEAGLDGREGNAKPMLQLPTPEQTEREKELKAAVERLDAALNAKDVVEAQQKWQAGLASQSPAVNREGLLAHYEFDGSLLDSSGRYQNGRTVKGDPTFGPGQIARSIGFDGQSLVTLGKVGAFERDQPFTLVSWVRYGGAKQNMAVMEKIDTAQGRRGWEVWLEDPVLVAIQRRAARVVLRLNGQWPEKALEVRSKDRLTQNEWSHVAFTYDGSGKAAGVKLYLNGKPAETDAVKDQLAGTLANESDLLIGVKEPEAKTFTGGLDDLRLYGRALQAAEIEETGLHYPMRAVISGIGGKLTKPEEERLRDYYLRYVAAPELQRQYAEWRDSKALAAKLQKQILTTMVMQELEKPRDTFVLARGDYRNQTEKVEPGTPAILPPLPKTEGRANRLALAKWLTDPQHPLTARVAVNRYWQMYFGLGLVKTAENFGSQGDPPSHPELLDWLATEFIRTGWDVKAIQKLIVTSATYQQSSHVPPELLERDPENRLLARGSRYRLPAEMVRDNALAVSGLLNGKVGGPSAFPYQPDGLWEELAFGDGFSMQTYVQSHGEDLYRRSMYTFWKRTGPPPQLVTFDAPDREKCVARRTTTNTPLQALILMNDPSYLEASRALATKVLKESKRDPAQRAALAFRLATSREPDKKELPLLVRLAKQQFVYYQRAPKEAAELLKNGESTVDATANPAELAAWTMVASTIFNLDETISKE